MLFESSSFFFFLFSLSFLFFSFIYLSIYSSFSFLLSPPPHLPTLPETHAPLLSLSFFSLLIFIYLFIFLFSSSFSFLWAFLPFSYPPPHLSWPTASIMPTTPPQHHSNIRFQRW